MTSPTLPLLAVAALLVLLVCAALLLLSRPTRGVTETLRPLLAESDRLWPVAQLYPPDDHVRTLVEPLSETDGARWADDGGAS